MEILKELFGQGRAPKPKVVKPFNQKAEQAGIEVATARARDYGWNERRQALHRASEIQQFFGVSHSVKAKETGTEVTTLTPEVLSPKPPVLREAPYPTPDAPIALPPIKPILPIR